MQVDLRANGIEMSDSLREHTRRCLNFGLDWANKDVDRVVITLSDTNGPRDQRFCWPNRGQNSGSAGYVPVGYRSFLFRWREDRLAYFLLLRGDHEHTISGESA